MRPCAEAVASILPPEDVPKAGGKPHQSAAVRHAAPRFNIATWKPLSRFAGVRHREARCWPFPFLLSLAAPAYNELPHQNGGGRSGHRFSSEQEGLAEIRDR